ncbi:hypothetical protein [Parapedobacter sp. DT-150]|uniref:hypothetical protein n=1 Tax=Parapedobacter sp. DT-150 TaxID=3396162 RepID=UPI003F1B83AB
MKRSGPPSDGVSFRASACPGLGIGIIRLPATRLDDSVDGAQRREIREHVLGCLRD